MSITNKHFLSLNLAPEFQTCISNDLIWYLFLNVSQNSQHKWVQIEFMIMFSNQI